MKKRCLCILLSLVLLFGLLPVPAAAATWDGVGTGTQEDPYLIKTKEQLISSMTEEGKYYALNNDLKFLPEDFDEGGLCYGKTYIGGTSYYSDYAYGNFDGRGHTIFGLEIPLVYRLSNTSAISNLNLADVSVSKYAVLAWWNYGSISNCTVTGTWYANAEASSSSRGGYLVESNYGTITGCRNTATTQITYPNSISSKAGFGYFGFCVSNYANGTISDCVYDGKIVCNRNETSSGTATLSFVGIASSNLGRIEGCENAASLSDFEMNGATFAGAFGIAGQNTGTIYNCKNSGNLNCLTDDTANTYKDIPFAGIVEHNSGGLVENCTNTGDVAYAGIVYRNGAGNNGGTITKCRNEGTVVGYQAGGIVYRMATASVGAKLTNCVNTGNIEATDLYNNSIGGGIAAKVNGPCEISGCINLGTVSAMDAGGIVGELANVGNSSQTNQDLLTAVLRECYNTGVISGIANRNCSIGGIVGHADPYTYIAPTIIEDVYNVGEICSNGCYTNNSSSVGGIVGYIETGYSTSNENAALPGITLKNCYSTGVLTSDVKETGSVVGTLYAYLQDGKTPTKLVDNCYALDRGVNAIGAIYTHADEGTQASATLLSAEEMGVQDSFTGFDFDTVWSMSDTLKRPYLSALGEDGSSSPDDGGDTPEEPDTIKITGLAPKNGATDVGYAANSPKFYISFNRKIAVDSSSLPQFDFEKEPFRIYRKSDNKPIYTAKTNEFIPGTCLDAAVTESNTQLVITPTNLHILLDPITDYYITMGEGFVKFEDGSVLPAIAKGDWAFRTDGTHKTGTFSFAGSNDKDITTDFTYSDDYFIGSSTVYNHDLALMSLKLAMSAFNRANVSYRKENVGKNVYDLLEKLEFDDINIDSYEGKPTRAAVGYAIGHKKILVNDKEYTLIALALRGANYEVEWADNLSVLSTTEHQGFKTRANEVKEALLSYIKEHAAEENLKLWITGYGRAAAISNQLAGTLDRALYMGSNPLDLGATLEKKNFYVYTFETPRPTALAVAKTEEYGNIHNIINPMDLVPKVAPTGWQYARYGSTYFFPSYQSKYGKEFTDNLDKVAARTLELCGIDLTKVICKEQGEMLDYVLRAIPGKPTDDAWIAAHAAMTWYIEDSFDTSKVLNKPTLLDQGKLLLDFAKDIKDAITVNIAGYVKRYLLDELWKKPFEDAAKTLVEYGICAHAPELTLAWMELIDGESSYVKPSYRQLRVNCPVDIDVFDSAGKLVAQFINDVPQKIEDSTIIAYLDNNGQKTVVLPLEETFTVQIKATGEGQMTYSVEEFNFDSGKSERVVNFYDVALAEGNQFEGTVPKDTGNSEKITYTLSKNSGNGSDPITPSEDLTGASDEGSLTFQVSTTIEGKGEVGGTGMRTKGEYAKLTAIPDTGWKFEGWYQGEKLLSSDLDYRFRVEKNTALTAKFVAGSTSTAPAITTTTLPNGTVGTAYSQTLAATGTTPITWSINSGNLPAGLSLNETTGEISGTPTTKGTFRFTVKATNSAGSDTKALSITIAAPDTPNPSEYTITFNGNGGTPSVSSMTTSGQKLTSLPGASRSNYSLDGWYTAAIGGTKITASTVFSANTTVYAHWIYTGNSGGNGSGSGSGNGGSGSHGGGHYNGSHTIKVTVGAGGSISPSGNVSVREGRNQTFTFTPDKGYAVSNVKIDGKSVGAVKSYTFENVTGDHTIEVTFVKDTASANTGDSSNLPLWSTLLLTSTLTLAGAVHYKRKRAR